MAFSWKEHIGIWKGEGIYFLTFTVTGRRKLLGTLIPVDNSRWYQENVQRFSNNDGKQLCATSGNGTLPVNAGGTLPVNAAGTLPVNAGGALPVNAGGDVPVNTGGDVSHSHITPALATSSLAITDLTPFGIAVSKELQNLPNRVPGLKLCAKQLMPDHIHVVLWVTQDTGRSIRQIGNGLRIGIKKIAIAQGIHNETAAHILDIPYIRTLAHKGQLRSMIDYVHANPDNAWMRQQNPALYVIQRNIQLAGLHFDGMGKDRLLAYPDRQVIALSRSLTKEQIAAEVARALSRAERGTVTYTAAINDGEKTVARAIREAGHPLVVMMLDGFPPEGTEAARYFHPDGVYHRACGEGRLMLLAPKASNYQHPELIALTEQVLERKAREKGRRYAPIPHDTTRWRMIAGNVMLRMIAEASPPRNAETSKPRPPRNLKSSNHRKIIL